MSAPLITSLQNQRVKDAAKLRDRRQRDKQRRFLIDGIREIERAIDADVKLCDAFVCPELLATDDARHLYVRLDHEHGDLLLRVTREVFEKLTFGERCDGIIATAQTPHRRLEDLRLPDDALICVLENVEKPGNLGAILRSADAAGISAVITADSRTDLFNPNAVRASLGTIFHVPTAIADADTTLAWLRERKFRIWATRVGSGPVYTEADYRGPTALVLGSEAEGLSARWWSDDIRPLHLPMLGRADSLNVSVAAAVVFYEALRQRSLA
ncbi:MAG: RNA methyltransferase [Pirellula sp.]|nr:RNA methyltransferase [Pirellula sp.]